MKANAHSIQNLVYGDVIRMVPGVGTGRCGFARKYEVAVKRCQDCVFHRLF